MSSSTTTSTVPLLSHILETCLYVRDVSASVEFYQRVLDIKPFMKTLRGAGFAVGHTTLLLFQLGVTAADIHGPEGTIPGHGPSETIVSSLLSRNGPVESKRAISLNQHFCFAVQHPEDVAQWDEHLQQKGIPITGRMDWERGGKSVYFEDLDGHVAEIGSRGIWAHYDLEK